MAKDRFTIPLKCPKCGKSGEADCWQEDGWAFMKGDHSTRVTGVTLRWTPKFGQVVKVVFCS